MTNHEKILTALSAWIAQRPGLEPGNYISHGRDAAGRTAYRSEQRRITAQRHDAERLLAAAALTGPHSDEAWQDAFRAYSGRLTLQLCSHGDAGKVTCGANPKHVWCERCDPAPSALCHWCHGRGYSRAVPGGVSLDYCTGQYWPTEYRAAVCAVLASLLWAHAREHMPAPSAYRVELPSRWDGDSWRKGPVSGTYATLAEAEAKRNGQEHVTELYGPKRLQAGDYLRAQFHSRFGARFASRWFR
jgi:hypothetical protein